MNPRTKDQEKIFELLNDDDVRSYQITTLQSMSKATYSYVVNGVALTAVITSEFIPSAIPQPFKEIMKAGLILANINTANALHALSERKYPCSGISWATPVMYTFASVLPLLTSVGLGYAIKFYGGETGNDALNYTGIGNSSYPDVQALSVLVNNPLAHMGWLALITYSQFGITKLLMAGCIEPVEANEEGGQYLSQMILKMGTGMIESVAMFEALRMVLFMTQQDAVLHERFFPLVLVGLDQLLKLWGYMSRIPTPLDALVSEDQRIPEQTIDELLNEGGPRPSSPSCRSIMGAVGYYSARATLAITLGGMTMLEVVNIYQAETDQEKLNSQTRLMNLFLIAGATGLVESAMDLLVHAKDSFWTKCNHYSPSLFSSHQYQIIKNEDTLAQAVDYSPRLR